MEYLKNIKFNSDGLVPCIAQDYLTREVLMMAWMNEESLKLTIETGYCTYYSRSRQKLWKKGEESGHVQKLISLSYDCDGDTLLALVEQTGAACHTGNRTCFYRPEPLEIQKAMILNHDLDVIYDRKIHPVEDSYTNYLFEKGIDKICKKVGEESAEIIIAAKNGEPKALAGEISDFLYHLMVLMADVGVEWEDVFDELIDRQGMKSQKLPKWRAQEKAEKEKSEQENN
ncbi:MAG: bifunctional phosphoribosyl-AMP cyclohydrolase/phosphoribosyl-ATP diphosphatase HisIE [Ruminococcaceae bacterium]|nr:bifunctional phosphoribosyl-AMP cyclohydrolase/phosphoribosyl-ATP diphosphatase HisIE [Oscillospiraceae bacterium]